MKTQKGHEELAQIQFGRSATEYATSSVHAHGASLGRLLEAAHPQAAWQVLDVATGGGHTALAFAPHVSHIVAGDLTCQMLDTARGLADLRGGQNISFCQHSAENFPFPPGTFDCVTCRLAPHHFPNVALFVKEAARVLKPAGILAVADNVIGSDPKTARMVNLFETLRDPSHVWCYTAADWETFLFSNGFAVQALETIEKTIDFEDWAARMAVAGDDLIRLQALLVRAPDPLLDALQPRRIGGRLIFTLTELIIVGKKPE
jgi:ubiquinone/menaquinone biosynthesis C-methylase UbiE